MIMEWSNETESPSNGSCGTTQYCTTMNDTYVTDIRKKITYEKRININMWFTCNNKKFKVDKRNKKENLYH